MGVYNNAALANSYFDDKVGELSVGSAADIIFVDYHPFTPLHAGNLPWHILFGFNESMVTTTMVNGKVLMRDRKLVTLDEEEISNKAKEHADIVWKNYQHSFN
jgi:cytosine/adenosine deaminase-related metal-dependent hydrolase